MAEDGPRVHGGLAAVLFGWALGAGVIAAWLVGARTAAALGDGFSATVVGILGLGLGALVCFFIPLALASPIVKVLKSRVHPAMLTFFTLAGSNSAVLALLLGLMPGSTLSAVARHGTWMGFGALDGSAQMALFTGTKLVMSKLGLEDPEDPEWLAAVVGEEEPVVAGEAPEAPALPDVEEEEEEPESEEEPPRKTAQKVFADAADSVVVVHTFTTLDRSNPLNRLFGSIGVEKLEGSGSGFVVGKNLIVTNHHVIDDATGVVVNFRDGRKEAPVQLLAVSEEHDLALLAVDTLDAPVLPIALADGVVEVGEKTYAIGAPLGLDWTLTEGILSAERMNSGTHIRQTQTPIAPGSSGGPLLNDRGQVVGVNTMTQGASFNMAVHVQHVHALLELERGTDVFESPEPGLELVSLELQAGELSPSERLGFATPATMLGRAAEKCIATLVYDAKLELTFSPRAARVASNLNEEDTKCLEDAWSGSSFPVAKILEMLGLNEGDTLQAEFIGMAVAEDDTRTREERKLALTVKLEP